MTEGTNKTQDPGQKVTREALNRAAYRYLERFASTEAQLLKVLRARIDRELKSCDEPGLISVARGLAVEIARRCVELGLVNDRLYGEAKARRLLARGKPLGRIGAALAAKGMGRADIEAALESLKVEVAGDDPDFAAAVAYARRRRLGPFARPGVEPLEETAQEARRRKEYAAMARAGFGYDLARRVLGAAGVDEFDG